MRYSPGMWSDFDQVWFGSRALLARRDPYAYVPKPFIPGPLFYPAPALIVGLPFSLLPIMAARVVFGAVTAGIATWAILRHHRHAWPLLLSAPLWYGVARGQWAPLLVAGALIPSLGGVMAAKPSIGLAAFAYRPSLAAVIGGVVLTLISFALAPTWLAEWLASARTAPHVMVPMLMPLGVVLLVALGRWRRPDARLLGVLACVPQSPAAYELFVMALVPRTLRQALIMGLSWNVLYVATNATHDSTPSTVADVLAGHWHVPWGLWLPLGYFPALLTALAPSPLRELPPGFSQWSSYRKVAYRVFWMGALGLVGCTALIWPYLVWRTR